MKTLKGIGLNMKGIREALEKIYKALKEFLQKITLYDHAEKVKHEFENVISFYHILLLGKFHQKSQPLVSTVHSKSRLIVSCANPILLSLQ